METDWRPNFSSSSPYYLKVSIAIVHVLGTLFMVVPNPVDNIPPEPLPPPETATATKFTILGMELWDVIVHGQPQSQPPMVPQNSSTVPEIQFVSPYIPYTWVKYISDSTHSTNTQLSLAFACLPLGWCFFTILAAMIPGSVFQGGYSKICKIMVTSMGFSVASFHMCMNLCIRVLGGIQGVPRIRIMVAAASLHIAIHTLYISSIEITQITKKTRRGTNQVMIAIPVLWFSIFLMHGIALFIMPIVMVCGCRWTTCYSPQDIISMHAITAFAPEIMGMVYSRFLNNIVSGVVAGPWIVDGGIKLD